MTTPAIRSFCLLLILLQLIVLCACAKHAVTENKLMLPSGEQITLVDEHGDSFVDVNGRQRHVFYVSYQTSHNINDLPAVRVEAQRMWAVYKPRIMGTDYDSCEVTPVQTESGGAASMEGRPFYAHRNPDGTWSPLE